jgi:hypothetical protein
MFMKHTLILIALALSAIFPAQAFATSPPVGTQPTPQCTIRGTSRNDVLRGTVRDDVICGLAGNDTISGGGGNDTILAGDGNDTVDAGVGNDRVDGGNGNDRIIGGNGNDVLSGGAGNDVIDAGAGDDVLNGNGGSDQLNAGDGDDALAGGSDRDRLQPGRGDNRCALDASDTTIGRCLPDTTAPVFAPMALTRSVNAGETATFEWIVDDESPIQLSWMLIGGTPGWITEWCGFGTYATAVSQVSPAGTPLTSTTFRVNCPIPANAVNGEYTVELNALDVFGNYATPQRIVLMVNSGSTDATPPEFSQLRASASVVDRTDDLTISWRVDDETGISGTGVWLAYNGYGIATSQGPYHAYTPSSEGVVTRTERGVSVQYTQKIRWNAHATAGRYTVWMSVRDTLGNRDFVKTDVTVTLR